MPNCNNCGEYCQDFISLAHHILDNKDSHKSGLKWAMNYKYKHVFFKPEELTRIPLTPQEKENKENTQRVISGETQYVSVICPSCRILHYQNLPVEFINDNGVWSKGDRPIVNCERCRK